MKASIYTSYGSPKVLQIKEVEMPSPKDHEVLIKVRAATVNRTDCAMLMAKPFIMRFLTGFFQPKKQILGTDFAGQVEAIGPQVKQFKVGDRIFGFDDSGLMSHAQHLCVSTNNAIGSIPEGITYQQAAASLEGAHYAYNFINKLQIEPGQKVLINGATGAIGSAALQLCKYFDLEITAVGNTKNLDLLKSLGADRVIDYLREDFTRDKEKYHYVFDAVGKSSFGKCKNLLNPGGVYISSELGWMAQNIFYALFTPIFNGKKVVFPLPKDRKASVLLMQKLLAERKFTPVIDRSYPLEKTAEAFAYVLTGQKTGNVLIEMS